MFGHKLREALAVNQDHSFPQVTNVVDRLGTKGRCRDKYPLCSTQPHKATYKALYIRAAYSGARFVSLCLHVDPIKAKAIFVDDPINAAISRSAELGSGT